MRTEGSILHPERDPPPAPQTGATATRGPPEADDFVSCVSCGERAMLDFCASCGERRLTAADYSSDRFLREAVRIFTNLDTTIGRSFRHLVRRPGLLTAEYFAGRRKPLLNPLQVFLVANLIFFVAHSFLPAYVFTTRLYDHLMHHAYSPLILDLPTGEGRTFRQLLDDAAAFEAYAHTFQVVTTALAKTLVIVMVPIFAAISWLFYRRHAPFYVQHLVFGLHFYAYMLLVTIVLSVPLAFAPALMEHSGTAIHWQAIDAAFGFAVLAWAVLYLAAAARRAFGAARPGAVAGAMVLGIGYFLVLYAYRLVLFLTTVAMI